MRDLFNKLPWIGIALIIISLDANSQGGSLALIKDGKSNYEIVVPHSSSSVIKGAAEILQSYIFKISGAKLPIISSDDRTSRYIIAVGNTGNILDNQELNKIKDEGFIIKTVDDQLIIAGKDDQGTLNGIYSFLEEYLSCNYFSPDAILIPYQRNIEIKPINKVNNPAYKFRDVFYKISANPDYSRWNKTNHMFFGKQWGLAGHTFFSLMPPSQYFNSHPKYYSLINGQRKPDQLCLSNPNVLKIIIQNLRNLMEQKSKAIYWTVSQEDNMNFCQCDQCKKLYQEYGGFTGALIHFVNEVAAQFPNKTIATLSYTISKKPPKNIKPASNVMIIISDIECNQVSPINMNEKNTAFLNNLEKWKQLTNNIMIWDYVVNFTSLQMPYPNLYNLQPNLQFFNSLGINMIFEQGDNQQGGEFNELKSWLLSKLMWDPNLNFDSLLNTFIYGYYGKAAPYILNYIDLLKNNKQKYCLWMGLYDKSEQYRNSFLSPSAISSYESIFNKAEAAVSEDSMYLARVERVRATVDFAALDLFADTKDRFTDMHKEYSDNIKNKLSRFEKVMTSNGIPSLSEGGLSTKTFIQNVQKIVKEGGTK